MTESKPEVKKRDCGNTGKGKPKYQYHQRQSNNQYHGGNQQLDRFATPRTPFKGEFPEHEGSYFDFSTSYRADMYENSIHIMSRYISIKYNNGEDIK